MCSNILFIPCLILTKLLVQNRTEVKFWSCSKFIDAGCQALLISPIFSYISGVSYLSPIFQGNLLYSPIFSFHMIICYLNRSKQGSFDYSNPYNVDFCGPKNRLQLFFLSILFSLQWKFCSVLNFYKLLWVLLFKKSLAPSALAYFKVT